MGKSLVIVESPTKAKTISRYLGKDYDILASIGHVKDLPKSELGVDVEQSFLPNYEVIRGKGKILKEIRRAAEKADKVYLAPDPDREGEAIAWHIANEIRKKNDKIYRILFHEITKQSVHKALDEPLELDQNKFESQQARRILDRLVGYQISPILWDKVQRGLSAGRVQSVAVKIVVDREKEIRAFNPEEYWTVGLNYLGSKEPEFSAKLFKIEGKKAEVKAEPQASAIVETLKAGPHVLTKVDKKERRRHPVPPFITSKLQQEASRRLRMSPKRTMAVAQQLYEGVELGSEGPTGLITYMRTDSTRVADTALDELRAFIGKQYGPEYLPKSVNQYKNKKGSQDAHEAIRPTSVTFEPDGIKSYLSRDQYRLYRLIWERFVASQMVPAVYDATAFDIECDKYLMRATGQVMKFPGFTRVYIERLEEANARNEKRNDGSNADLPDLVEGETVKLLNIDPKQNFTQPPPRFSEAMLVKELEDRGIGRPSTYASILSTIQDKKYVRKLDGRLSPNELGEVVTELLVENFPDIMNSEFTATMEEQLDDVEEGKLPWLDVLRRFYSPFSATLEKAKEHMRNVKRQEKPIGMTCPKCKVGDLHIKWGRNGSFVGCSSYPDCDFTSEYKRDDKGEVKLIEDPVTDEICEKCGSAMVIKNGRFGKFLACSNYPACRNTKPVKVGVKCPEEGCKGDIIEKRTRKGKLFFGCDQFPKCRFASWDRPVAVACPVCQNPFMVEKGQTSGGTVHQCPKCGFRKEKEEVEDGQG